jgi:hypothetical protein
MAESVGDNGDTVVVERRGRWRTILTWVVAGILLLIVAALVIAWIERRPIARDLIKQELESRGVTGSFTLDRVGLRTQQISNLSIGDPKHPDLTAKRVLIQMRLRLNGSIDVYRIVARGVRLRGTVLKSGRVSWGQIDKLLPPPSGKPFSLPDVAVDIADSSISLKTPWGPFGFAVHGSGNLTGGFKGNFVSYSPKLDTGRCTATGISGHAAIEVKARHPHVVGPLIANQFSCPASRFSIVQPRLDLDVRFGEAFDDYDAKARIMSQVLTAGDNGLAAMNGRITLVGDLVDARGAIDLSAQKSRLGTITAERTQVKGKYRLKTTAGSLVMVGEYLANGASLSPSMTSGLTGALEATKSTPIGPVAHSIATAIRKSAESFDVSGGIRLVNFPGYGAARITDAKVITQTGGQATISGGKGVTYFWPKGQLRINGTIAMAGGGLPAGSVTIRQAENGAISGFGNFRPYVVDGSRLTLSTLRFNAEANGATSFSTVAGLTGNFPGGQVQGLNLPIDGTIGPNGGIAVGKQCVVVSWDQLKLQALQLGRTRLPVCPTGVAIISKSPGGALRVGGRISKPALAGSIGSAPMRLNANSILLDQQGFNGSNVALRIGGNRSPVFLHAEALKGAFASGGAAGTLTNADAVIGTVPLKMTDIDGKWRFVNGRLGIDGSLVVNDRADPPRFYPLKSNDVHFVLADNTITTTGTLRHPGTGTLVTDVDIEHNLNTGAGHADLDVPGITFGPNLQPDELTRLTEGVVALVQGTVQGHGRIDWTGSGAVTSTGDFSTRNMDLAAPFGPVEGLATSIHFTDLLNLETAPGQVATVRSTNPGIIVDNGVIRYQLLPNNLVKIERGEWPFMGGKLILDETILNFGSPSPKRLTFELQGFDARQFIDNLGFAGLQITGTFDGVLPMIFDESGGRIVGGRLDSRDPGGEFAYTGTKPKAGMVAGLAFDLLSDIKYRSMTIRLDGDLAGEFATRFTIRQISLSNRGGLAGSLIRGAFKNVPLQVNLNISGPFRALIQMAKGFKDPRQVIAPVMPFPLDSPGIVTEVRVLGKQEEQTPTTPTNNIDVSTKPPQPSEK